MTLLSADTERQQAVTRWAHDLMERRDFVILDTETTGVDSRAEIVQVVVVNAWGRVAFQSLVRPEEPIDEAGEAFAIHGVSADMAAQSPRFCDVNAHLSGWLRGKRSIVAYNSAFDSRIIDQCCRRFGAAQYCTEPWECAMLKFAQWEGSPGKFSGYRWHKLQAACALAGCRLDRNWHDAAADALATWDLIARLAERWEG